MASGADGKGNLTVHEDTNHLGYLGRGRRAGNARRVPPGCLGPVLLAQTRVLGVGRQRDQRGTKQILKLLTRDDCSGDTDCVGGRARRICCVGRGSTVENA